MASVLSSSTPLLQSSPAPHREGIGYFGSLCLTWNSLTGAGLAAYPSLFQDSGLVVPLLYMVACALASGMACALLVRAISLVSGNAKLVEKVEYSTVGELVLSRPWYYLFQVFLNLSLQLANIASIVVSVQVMDTALIAIFGKTCALKIASDGGFLCVVEEGSKASPFGESIVISLGFMIVLLCVVPLSFWNIEDNIIVQIVAFFVLLAIGTVWVTEMLVIYHSGHATGSLPLFTNKQSGIVGVNMLNFAFLTTIPSWVGEKKRSVGVHSVLWPAIVLGVVFFAVIASVGSVSFKLDADSDLLSALSASPHVSKVGKACTYLYPAASLMSSIPVFSIIIRENLLDGHIVNRPMAIFFAVVFPWFVAVPLGNGGGFNDLVKYGSTIFNTPVCFLAPPIFYWLMVRKSAGDGDPSSESIQGPDSVLVRGDGVVAVAHEKSNGGDMDGAITYVGVPRGLRFLGERSWSYFVFLFSLASIIIMVVFLAV